MAAAIRPVPDWQPLLLVPSLVPGGRLLLWSAGPAVVETYGVVYQEALARPFRVCMHHTNGTGAPAGVYVAVRNRQHRPAAVTARATGAAWGPEPALAGARALHGYLGHTGSQSVTLPPLAWARWGVPELLPGETFSGVYDLDPQGPVQVYAVAAPAGADADPDCLPVLPAAGGRGSFANGDREGRVSFSLSRGTAAVALGNTPASPRAPAPGAWPLPGEFEPGFSHPDGRVVALPGNSGVLYHLAVELVNDLGGWQTVEFVFQPTVALMGAAEFDGQAVVTPDPVPAPGWGWWAHAVSLAPGEVRRVRLRWMQPGGSRAPVLLVLNRA